MDNVDPTPVLPEQHDEEEVKRRLLAKICDNWNADAASTASDAVLDLADDLDVAEELMNMIGTWSAVRG